jgi:hypothetical protein
LISRFPVLSSTQGGVGTHWIDLVSEKNLFFAISRNVNNNFVFPSLRTCAWGQFKPEDETEKQDEAEKPDSEEMEAEPKEKPLKKDPYDFIVSGALGNPENPEVKVWRLGEDIFTPLHSLTEHSLGIVSVDVSPNGKCK